MRYLSLDPGATTGWAVMERGKPLKMGESPLAEFHSFLRAVSEEVELYVVEDYIIRPASVQGGYSHQWNKGEALQVIGAVKYQAFLQGAEVVLQQPSVKPMGAKVSGIPYTPGKSGTHMFDAILHGCYYWYKKEGPSAENEIKGGSGDSAGAGVRPPTRITQVSSYKGLRKAGGKKRV